MTSEFKTETFDDLTLLSKDKLTKLRDRAAQNALESARQAQEDMERYREICHELETRN